MKIIKLIYFVFFINLLFADDIFVINSVSGTLSKINLETNEVNNEFSALGYSANKMDFFQNQIYVLNSGDNAIQVIDANSGETISNIYLESSSNPYDIIIKNNFAYVTGALSNKVYKVDLLTEEVISSCDVGENPNGMAILDNYLYVGNTSYMNDYENCTLAKIDLTSFTLENSFVTGINPQYLLASNGKIHISCSGNWNDVTGEIQVYNPETDEISLVGYFDAPVGNLVEFHDVILVGDAFGEKIYSYNKNDLSIINGDENPITPGAQLLCTYADNFYTLGGSWGFNFHVKKWNEDFQVLQDYEVLLAGTDIKFLPSNTSINEVVNYESNLKFLSYTNPVYSNSKAKILFENKLKGITKLEIYNIKGQLIKSDIISSSEKINEIEWNLKDYKNQRCKSGCYFYKLTTDKEFIITKVIIIN